MFIAHHIDKSAFLRLTPDGLKEIIRPWGDRDKFQEKFQIFSLKRQAEYSDNEHETVEKLKRRKISLSDNDVLENVLTNNSLTETVENVEFLDNNMSKNYLLNDSLNENVSTVESSDCDQDLQDDSLSGDELLVDLEQ